MPLRSIVIFAMTTGSLTTACESQPSPVVRAAGEQRTACDGSTRPEREDELLQGTTILKIEPVMGHIFDAMHAVEQQVIGAKLLVRPPAALTADQMMRILQCHRSRVLLGEENAAAVANDPYLLPDAWVDIDVRSEDGNFAIVLSSDTVRLNLELLGRAKHYAHDHMVAIQPMIR
jgi:hypothetical protein